MRPWDQWLSDTRTPRPSPIDRVFCWEMTPSALQRTHPGYSDTAAKQFMHLHPQNEGRPRSSPHRQINKWEKLNLLHIICLQKSQLPTPIWQSLQLMEHKERFPNNVFRGEDPSRKSNGESVRTCPKSLKVLKYTLRLAVGCKRYQKWKGDVTRDKRRHKILLE